MASRPVYVGVGECKCGRLDEKLYHTPNTVLLTYPMCGQCLLVRGFEVPEPRTADDILDTDGKLQWKVTPLDVHVGRLDLGHDHFFEAVVGNDGKLAGWLHTHPDARSHEGMLCQSFCAVRPLNDTPVHQVLCAEPLTLTPSLKCRTCGAHGEVVNGHWMPNGV